VKIKLLKGKRILIVDDEADVLESLEDLLPMCKITKAQSFAEAKRLLENECFDIAILDIMGVDGYQLLEIADKKNVIPVMLTAHAFSMKDTLKSFKKGAASYIPKEEMARITIFLNDILEAREKGKSVMNKWLERFSSYYDNKFGEGWQKEDKEFWDNFKYWI